MSTPFVSKSKEAAESLDVDQACCRQERSRRETYIQLFFSRAVRLLIVLLLLSGIWGLPTLRRAFLARPDLEFAALCPQTLPLVPTENAELWERLSQTLKTETFVDRVVDLLGGGIRIPTEVYDDWGSVGEDIRWEVFAPFHEYLLGAFPQIHATLELTKVNTYGLVYVWKGSDTSLKPLLLTAHQDVVPVNPETYDQWVHPPFSGYYDGAYIWGRGSVDDKGGLIGLMTAVEVMLEHGFIPRRGIVLALGFDEEARGREGALSIAQYLLSTYGEDAFAMLVDEGGEIQEQYGSLFALPSIAEKGYLDVNIDVSAPGGHSSVPPLHTTIGMLAEMLVHYENNPFEAEFKRDTPMYKHAQCFAEHAPGLPESLRDAIKRSQSSDKALRRAEALLFQDPVFKALVSTTQAVDMISGGVKSNALPENAVALIDHRIAADSSVAAVKEHSIEMLKPFAARFNLSLTAFGERLTDDAPTYGSLTLSDAWDSALEPAPITPTGRDSAPFQLLSGTIKAAYHTHHADSLEEDEINVIPSLASGNTDTQFYWKMTRHIFRYTHYNAGSGSGLDGVHTVNEACLADGLVEMIRFFTLLILNADEASAL